jgi:GDPmannose 4,6-dehydratase
VARTALITGIGGQDGSYLAEHLLGLGYRVVGVARGTGVPDRIRHLADRVEIITLDLLDEGRIAQSLRSVEPDEVYNLAGHSFVPSSWDRPDLLGEVTGLAAPRLLEAIRVVNPAIRFYQASSSEIFGNALESPQRETTPVNPRNPYGAAKAFAHFSVLNARAGMGLFAVSGILYNHESPRRGLEFVSRKITDGAARISLGLATTLAMGDLDAKRDWGFAGDYVRAMHLMLQQDTPRDYVIASGVAHTVRDFCRIAFAHVGIDYMRHVSVDPELVRAPDTAQLLGDPSLARTGLRWQPTVSFEALVEMMVDADLERYRGENATPDG